MENNLEEVERETIQKPKRPRSQKQIEASLKNFEKAVKVRSERARLKRELNEVVNKAPLEKLNINAIEEIKYENKNKTKPPVEEEEAIEEIIQVEKVRPRRVKKKIVYQMVEPDEDEDDEDEEIIVKQPILKNKSKKPKEEIKEIKEGPKIHFF